MLSLYAWTYLSSNAEFFVVQIQKRPKHSTSTIQICEIACKSKKKKNVSICSYIMTKKKLKPAMAEQQAPQPAGDHAFILCN